jgi:beta-1,4-mannosyl-glycoprotein beta-1,4-N-acetylglucosaminyltransferase
MKVSIVLPTYNHLSDCLIPCVESILKWTDLSDIEVIVSANGCKDGTRDYLNTLPSSFKIVWNDEPLGYTKATNEGMKVATGEYIVLLNNDTVILDQGRKNVWIDMLMSPFLNDPRVGLTGPMVVRNSETYRDFVIFFCAMFKKEVMDKIGYLDEIFNPGFGEDVDYAIRIKQAGYKIVQVPSKSEKYAEPNFMIGEFPIFHKGEVTFSETPDGENLLRKNRGILTQKYPPKFNLGSGDMDLPDYINVDLNNPRADIKADVRNLSFIADGVAEEVLSSHVVEHFTPYEVSPMLSEWCRILKPGGKIVIEMPNIAGLCKAFEASDRGGRYMLLNAIYGAAHPEWPHLYGWYPEILWDHLTGAGFVGVEEKPVGFVNLGVNFRMVGYKTFKPVSSDKPKIYDCFTFFNELDVLEIRLNELYDVVDKFILVEANLTHSGKPKPMYFKENEARYSKFLDKIIYIRVDFPTDGDKSPWFREGYQRDMIARGLEQVSPKDDDIIIVSDSDEIASGKAVEKYIALNTLKPAIIQQTMYHYFLNCQANKPWQGTRILRYELVKRVGTHVARILTDSSADAPEFKADGMIRIENGGWHFTYLVGNNPEALAVKIQSFAHTEFDKPEYTNNEHLSKCINEGKDPYNRASETLSFVNIDDTYPKYVVDNKDKFISRGLVRE